MLSIPGTIDNWYDQSYETVPEIVDTAVKPLFLTAFSSDKGPVGLRRVSGENFYKLYGQNIDFNKHGQPLLQAASIINAGGELLCSRVVADDATLANTIIVATVKTIQTQKTNDAGELLYIDAVTGGETTEANDADGAPNEKAYVNTATIKYSAHTVENIKTYDDILTNLTGMIAENDELMEYSYPLFVITDNGVGESNKRFKFSTNYQLSKSTGFAVHQFIYCGSENFDYEYINFSTILNNIYNNQSMSLDMASVNMVQLDGHEYAEGISRFYERINAITGIDTSELETYDLLLAKDNRGKALSTIDISADGLDLSADIGIPLASGSNGSFGNKPISAESYEAQLLKVFDGTLTDDIYDLDQYQIDACVDANFPKPVKKVISELAAFRKDFYYFCDMGFGVDSLDQVTSYLTGMKHDKFTSYYFQNGTIIDPFSKRYAKVTLAYGIASKLVKQFISRYNAPFCGIIHDFVFTEFIEGSINWLPKITPQVSQKEQLNEINVNYASIINKALTLETEYTSQDAYSQLSFINNVTAIQKVIKDVRYNCPRFRYSLATTDDLNDYRKNVNEILKKYKSDYKTLEIVFVQDEIMKANKIFEVALKVVHKDFYQSEVINIYTLSTVAAAS